MTKDQLIKKYGRRESTPQESAEARALIFDDTDNFTALLLAMRSKAMDELGISEEDDFLEDLLRERAPKAYLQCNAFGNVRPGGASVSAMAASDGSPDGDIFSYLRSTLL